MNSLPENVSVVVNHRIAIQDSVQAVKDHYVNLLTPWARKWRFNLHPFGAETRPAAGSCAYQGVSARGNDVDSGDVTLSAQYELESSPVSNAEDSRFRLLAGAIKGVFGDDVVVAPDLLSGKCDAEPFVHAMTLSRQYRHPVLLGSVVADIPHVTVASEP